MRRAPSPVHESNVTHILKTSGRACSKRPDASEEIVEYATEGVGTDPYLVALASDCRPDRAAENHPKCYHLTATKLLQKVTRFGLLGYGRVNAQFRFCGVAAKRRVLTLGMLHDTVIRWIRLKSALSQEQKI
jgi:hypothetical protein